MAHSSHLAWPSPRGRSHGATRDRSLSLIALQFTPALGTAVTMVQITGKQCHACFTSILVRGRATQIAQKSRTCIGLHQGGQCQYKVPSRQDRGTQVRHRDVDIQVDLLHTGMKTAIKKKFHLGIIMLVLQDRPHGDEMKVVRFWQALVSRVVKPSPGEDRETTLYWGAIDCSGCER